MATDAAGNTTLMTVAVRVPHDHSGWANASAGFNVDGTGFDNSCDRFGIVLPSRPQTIKRGKQGRQIVIDGYDATEIDPHYVYVGNQKDALRPVETRELDVNGDGMMDLAVFYSVSDALILQSNLSRGSVGGERIALSDNRLDPGVTGGQLWLHYESPDGGEYLVSNIFELGLPVELVEGGALNVSDDGGRDSRGATAVMRFTSVCPNPFRSATTVSFELTAWENVKVQVFDVRGKLVRTLKNANLGPGRHRVAWDGKDSDGQRVGCGIYIVQLDSKSHHASGKAIVLK
jgi:hypothetical protein